MEEKIKKIIADYKIGPKNPIVIAVSGGVDSVVLLDLFAKNLKKGILVAHINHGLRKESDVEEKFVKDLSLKYEFSFYSKKLKLRSKSENEARKARYKFLRKVKDRAKAKYIVTAHHLNDQAETVLLNLVRGTGPLEIWGMQELKSDILRPLLEFPKKDILAYAKKNRLKFMEDKSNKKLTLSRNRIRHKIIPELRKINPKFLDNLKNEIQLGHEANESYERIINKALMKVKKENTLNLNGLKKFDQFTQKVILRKMVFEMIGKREGVYSKNIKEIFNLIEKSGVKKTSLKRFTITKNYDKIDFGSPVIKIETPQKTGLKVGETKKFGAHTLKCFFEKTKSQKNNILLPRSFAYNLYIRTWQPGDKIKTKVGIKKLQDIFSDAKISQHKRKNWPVIVSGKEILWIPMLQASNRSLSEADKNTLVIEVKNYER